MFLHIKTFDKQISFDSAEATAAVPEEKDGEGKVIREAVSAKPAEPLKIVLRRALDFWKQPGDNLIVLTDTRKVLDPYKTPQELGLKENDMVIVMSKEVFDKEEKEKADRLAAEEKAKVEAPKVI